MKKLSIFAACLATLFIASCGKKEMTTVKATITEMTDTTITAKVENDSMLFSTKKATYTNGAVMSGDSVVIYYVKGFGKKHATAAVVELIPPKGTIVEVGTDTTKELKAVPMTDEEVKEFDNFVEHEKQRRAEEKN